MSSLHVSNSLAAALLTVGLLAASGARADEPVAAKGDQRARAQQLFESALTDAEAGNFASACPKFLASQEADPKTSTLLNLASCYEKNGQTASAWGAFREAEVLARKAARTDWETSARTRADALEPQLLRLSILVADPSRDLVIMRDGARLAPGEWGVAIPVDPGDHVVSASSPGHVPWETRIDVREAATKIEVPKLALVPAPPPEPAPITPLHRTGWSTLKTAGAGAAGVGALGMVAGGIVGLVAKGNYNDARAQCSDGVRGCPATAVADSDSAYGLAAGATVVFVVSAVVAAGGVALFLLAPDERAASPSATRLPPRLTKLAITPGGLLGTW